MQPSHKSSLSLGHLLLALSVITVWGMNFVLVKISLEEIPPLTLCALRFFLAAVPAIFFIKKPNAPWQWVAAYGLLIFAAHFSLLFVGMNIGVAPGIAALLLQFQVFFTIFFAYLFFRQPASPLQLIGALVAFAGIVIIFTHLGGKYGLLGMILVLAAAACWAGGNVISVKLGKVNMFSLVIWGSAAAFFPLLAAAIIIEGPQTVLSVVTHLPQLPSITLFAVAYIIYASTYFGYGAWSWLLSQYTMASVAPLVLLTPIVAMFFSSLILDETFETWKILAVVLVLTGTGINLLGERIKRWAINTFRPAIPAANK
jgi:O-acetylserine/cysteine efflux transporter